MSASKTPLGWRFWLIALSAAVAMVMTASLGQWQLRRAAEKQELQTTLEQRAAQPALDNRDFLSQLSGADEQKIASLLYRPVKLQGRWLPEHTVYLDNRQMDAKPGFFVMTPLLLQGGSDVVLVQRGWVGRNFQDRMAVPEVPTPEAWVQIEGRIAASPSRLFELGGNSQVQGASRIRQNLELGSFRLETGLPLLAASVVQTDVASEGLLRNWLVVGAGVDKHYGYAFQWFGLCGLIALLYVWFQIVRRFILPRRRASS